MLWSEGRNTWWQSSQVDAPPEVPAWQPAHRAGSRWASTQWSRRKASVWSSGRPARPRCERGATSRANPVAGWVWQASHWFIRTRPGVRARSPWQATQTAIGGGSTLPVRAACRTLVWHDVQGMAAPVASVSCTLCWNRRSPTISCRVRRSSWSTWQPAHIDIRGENR